MTRNQTILVVDDDASLMVALSGFLQSQGFSVVTASNGLEALQRLQRCTPDLILCDVTMPKMDGYQLLASIREEPTWISIPFIFLTAKGEKADVRKGLAVGSDAYITKPFEPEDLLMAVQNRLKRAAELGMASEEAVETTKQQLLDVFSHELRTPLSLLHGYFAILHDDMGSLDDRAIDKILKVLRESVDRIVRLVEDLMHIVELDSGIAEIDVARRRQLTDLGLLVHEAWGSLSPRAEKRGISASIHVADGLEMMVVPGHMTDLFCRLIDNAIKFSHPDGRVEIEARAEAGWAVVAVCDHGIGIAPQQQARLFRRLEQINRQQQEQQGLGLGLAIAHRLAKMYGGDIGVESRVGEGATFVVRLPLASAAAVESH